MRTTLGVISIITMLAFFYSCSDDDDSAIDLEGVENIRTIDTLRVDDMRKNYQTLLSYLGTPDDEVVTMVNRFKYDVVLTVISYKVKDPFGNLRTLSGVVSYPVLPDSEKSKKLRIYSFLHGTIASNDESLSSLGGNDMLGEPIIYFSAHEKGYIGVFPDYFGYGVDKDNMHYYGHGKTLAAASRGMIDAIPTYTKQRSLNLDFDKLYISGYSEGAVAALSTLKNYSEKSSRFKDFVTIGGAGAYDTKQTFSSILEQTEGTTEHVASYAWIMMAYNKVYNINRDYAEIFKPEYVDVLKKHDGKNSIFESMDALPTIPSDLFLPDFTNGIINEGEKDFIKALEDNNVSDFDAKGSIYLIHGDQDSWVPPFNTDLAYDRLKARGVNVEKRVVEGGTHEDLTTLAWRKIFIEELNK
ncbi:MAG: hypothetical protein E6772_15390 [Dysgonomonas sp.]|nr:hypothetical protein [Dysgonomonas sp.]